MDSVELFKRLYAPSPLPSKDRSRSWHYAGSPGLASFDSSDKSGKWCIFCEPATVDAAWEKVKAATESGRLLLSKVSTQLSLGERSHHVICVYTEDWSSQEDLLKTREVLRELGFTEPLGYKRDIETINRVYGEDEWYLKA